MPPRYSYWTIIAGGLPTAFRAAEREELMPTFTRLRGKHPDAEMKWFTRGKLFDSPEAAREQLDPRRRAESGRGERDRSSGPRAESRPRTRDGEAAGEPPRTRDWRPGGEHRDPRQKFIDAKKAKNLDRRKEKFARKHGAGDKGGDRPARRDWNAPSEDTRPPKRDWDRPREGGPAASGSRPNPAWSKGGNRPTGPKREWTRDAGGEGGARGDARPPKRDWDRPREGEKRAWTRPRDEGRRPGNGDREGGAPGEGRRPHAKWDRPGGRWDPLESTCRHASLSIL